MREREAFKLREDRQRRHAVAPLRITNDVDPSGGRDPRRALPDTADGRTVAVTAPRSGRPPIARGVKQRPASGTPNALAGS